MEQHKRNMNYVGIPSTFKEILGRKAWYAMLCGQEQCLEFIQEIFPCWNTIAHDISK
jgi:hypothetical protein